jgi:hypothetical protein
MPLIVSYAQLSLLKSQILKAYCSFLKSTILASLWEIMHAQSA